MGQRPHVPLREPRGRGHRVAVREERPSLRWRLGDGHDFGESLAARNDPLVLERGRRTGDDVVRRQQQPHPNRRSAGHRRDGQPGRPASLTRRQVQRHDRERGCRRQDRRRSLHPERRQQQEAGSEAAADGAGGIGKIENARAAADRPVRALGQGVRQRKAETHQERRQSHFQQDRPGVEPQLLERSRRIRFGSARHVKRAIRGHGAFDDARVRGSQPHQRKRDEDALHHHQPHGRPRRAPAQRDPRPGRPRRCRRG